MAPERSSSGGNIVAGSPGMERSGIGLGCRLIMRGIASLALLASLTESKVIDADNRVGAERWLVRVIERAISTTVQYLYMYSASLSIRLRTYLRLHGILQTVLECGRREFPTALCAKSPCAWRRERHRGLPRWGFGRSVLELVPSRRQHKDPTPHVLLNVSRVSHATRRHLPPLTPSRQLAKYAFRFPDDFQTRCLMCGKPCCFPQPGPKSG